MVLFHPIPTRPVCCCCSSWTGCSLGARSPCWATKEMVCSLFHSSQLHYSEVQDKARGGKPQNEWRGTQTQQDSNLRLLWAGCPRSQRSVRSSWQIQPQCSWHRSAWSRRIPSHPQSAKGRGRQSPYEARQRCINTQANTNSVTLALQLLKQFRTCRILKEREGGKPFSLCSLHCKN